MARRGVLLGVILILFGAFSILGPVHGDNSTNDDSSCKRIQSDGGLGKEGILCVGQLTNDRLMVITRDWNVYQLPSNSFAPSTNKLYLGDAKPVPIAEKWPQIASNTDFKRVQKILYDIYFYANGNVNLLFLETKEVDHPDQTGVTFNVDTQKAYKGYHWRGESDGVFTSSYEVNKFYRFVKKDGHLQLQLFKCNCTDPNDLTKNCAINSSGDKYNMCKKGASKVILKSADEDSKGDCTSVDWPILRGFLLKKKIYLLGNNYVITFPETLYRKHSQSVLFQTVPYNSFIQCGGNATGPKGNETTKHPPRTIGWIIAIVLILLLLLLGCLLFVFREAMAKKKKKTKKGSKGDQNIHVVLRKRGSSVPLSKARGSGISGRSKRRTPTGGSGKRGSPLVLKRRHSGGSNKRPSPGISGKRSGRASGFGLATQRSERVSPNGVQLTRGPTSGRSSGRQSTRSGFKVSRPRTI